MAPNHADHEAERQRRDGFRRLSGAELIEALELEPHPEGGHYRQTWVADGEGRPIGTCIYFLLREGERSHWHRVDATALWHRYAGAPLVLSTAPTLDGPAVDQTLGVDFAAGERPQIIVPTGHWQSARSLGRWTLAGCTVSPGFQFEGFELAEPDVDIPRI